MALRDSTLRENDTVSTEEQHASETPENRTRLSHIEATDAFFAALGAQDMGKIITTPKAQTPIAQRAVQRPVEQAPQARNNSETQAILRAIESLREEVRDELSILKGQVGSLQRTSAKHEKAIQEMQKPFWKKILGVFASEKKSEPRRSTRFMPMVEELGIRELPAGLVAPLPDVEQPAAIIRTIDEAQPNIVEVTREGSSYLQNSYGPVDFEYGWNAGKIVNGVEEDLSYGQPLSQYPGIRGNIDEGSPEYVGVQPRVTVEKIAPNQLRVEHTNLKPGTRLHVGDFWSRGADAYGGHDGSWSITLPWRANEATAFVEIQDNASGAIVGTGLFFRFRGGTVDMSQTHNFGNANIPSWMNWSRLQQRTEVVSASAYNDQGDMLYKGVDWKKGEVLTRPGSNEDIVYSWTSPSGGTAKLSAILRDAQPNLGDGITYSIRKISAGTNTVTNLYGGLITDGGNLNLPEGVVDIEVDAGDKVQLVVSARGTNNDPSHSTGDGTITKVGMHFVETEKTYEKVAVAPSIQLRMREDGRALFVDYRNMPEGVALMFRAKDHYQQTRQFGMPTGTGTAWLNLNDMEPTPNVQVEVFLLHGVSEGGPLEEKKLYFDAQLGSGNPFISNVSTERQIFGSIAHEVLKDPNIPKTEIDYAEELSVSAYLQYAANPPARNWTDGVTFNQIEKARQFGALSQSDLMNEPLNGHGELYKIVVPTSPTLFERHTLFTDGNVEITNVYYVKADGLYKLPHMYYDRLPNGDIITKPAELTHVVLEFRLHGHLARGSEQSDNIVDVQPIEGQHLVGGIERIFAQPVGQARWADMILDIQQGESAVLNPGTTVGIFAHIQGYGTEGGNVTLRTYCTYDGNITNVQPQNTLSINLSASGKKAVFFDAHAALPGPSSDARGIITMEVEYADGRRQVLSSRLTRSLGYDEVEQAVEAARREKTFAGMPMFATDGKTVIGMGGNLFKDQQTLALQYMQMNGENPTPGSGNGYDNALFTTGNAGVGGADIPPATLETLQRSLARYTNGLVVAGVNARTETLMGRVILGAIDKILSSPSISSQQPIFKDLSEITGISEWKIARASRLVAISVQQDRFLKTSASTEQTKAQLTELFSYAGLNSAFGSNQGNPLQGIVGMHINKPNYTLSDREINIRFNLASSLNGYDAMKIFLRKNNGDVISMPIAAMGANGAMHMKVPVSSVLEALGTNQPQHISFILSADRNGQIYHFESAGFIIEQGPMLDLSTSSDSEKIQMENQILNLVKDNTPFRRNDGDWTVTLGSGAHDGNDFYALDIGFNQDGGRDVLAIADGTISGIDLSFGTVTINHAATPNLPQWQSQVMHLPIYKTNRNAANGNPIFVFKQNGNEIPGLEIWIGKEVLTADRIGIVGGRGISNTNSVGYDEEQRSISDKAFVDHIHTSIRVGGRSINLAKLLAEEAWNLPIMADSGHVEEKPVIWDPSISISTSNGAYKIQNTNIVFYRDPLISDNKTNDRWVAWHLDPTKRYEVRMIGNDWFAWDSENNSWLLDNGKKLKWINNDWLPC